MTVRCVFLGGDTLELAEGRFYGLRGSVNAAERGDLRQLLATCVLCNETRIEQHSGCLRLNGSATETALVHLAMNAGMDVLEFLNGFRLIGFNHRSENRLFMSSLHHADDHSRRLSVKGSPSEVLAMCDAYMVGDCVAPLTETVRNAIEIENARMAGNALRVLGFAFRMVNGDDESADDQKLIWLGLAGLADPVRRQARDLIEVFHRAGVNSVMITGDQSATAYAVASELNLSGGRPVQILDSSELNHLDEASLQALAKNTHAYARVSPAHKLQIVRALQAAGKTVAMTGDGINDGPALRAADIGIAMGLSGTDVARDVADIILEEDQLEILAAALSDGRAIYDNIRKTVHFLLATNISEIMLIFAAMASGIGFPLNIMQLLWVNLISDILPGLALSQEAPDPDILTRVPREAKAPLFSGSDFRTMIREAGVITGGALAAYGFGLARYGAGPAARTLAFQSLTVGQLLHAISCRSEYRRSQGSAAIPPNPLLSMAVGGSLCLQALTLFLPPLRSFLGLSRIGLIDLAVIAGSAMTPFLINQTAKPTKERKSC
jgi:Ca2+-transporting ATPase